MTIGLGLIGAGCIGQMHATAAAKLGRRIVGCCDVDEQKATALAAEHDGAVATTSMDDLLALPDVDAIVVGVPNHLHRDCAIAALRAGKDVLLEKPMALTVAECDEIVAAMKETGRIVQVGFVTRFSPAVLAVKRLIDSGQFGRIYHVRAQWFRRRGIPGLGGWFTTRERSGGGVLIDLGVHLVDLMLHLSGRPRVRRVSGVCTSNFGVPIDHYAYTEMWSGPVRDKGVFDVEDGATGLLRCDDGVTMEFTTSWAANVPESMLPGTVVLLGERGGCYCEIWGDTVVASTEIDGSLVDIRPQLPPGEGPWADAWAREHELFADCVRNRTAPVATAEQGREVQAILEALYRSSEAGREVEV
ncbi:MAG: Gfo/Idh/MocA family oxidoreductase [Planctomycetes bacterium]|nr:Gfo/Idh/MocA family oxidoreductase [Planctomycetota bacterium]